MVVHKKFIGLTASLILGVTSMGFVSTASANAIYSASSTLSLSLATVISDKGKKANAKNWSVSGEEYLLDYDSFTSGDGEADYSYNESLVDLRTGKTYVQTTSVSGNAGVGIAESYVETQLDLWVENFHAKRTYEFTFNYEYLISASVGSKTNLLGDDALSDAGIDVLDDSFSVDILEYVTADLLYDPLEDVWGSSGTFSVIVGPNGENLISSISSVGGNAVGVHVPEPATLLLFGLGLIGLGASRVRKTA